MVVGHSELLTLVLSAHFETVLIVELFCAAGLNMRVKHPHFRIWSVQTRKRIELI